MQDDGNPRQLGAPAQTYGLYLTKCEAGLVVLAQFTLALMWHRLSNEQLKQLHHRPLVHPKLTGPGPTSRISPNLSSDFN